MIKTCTIRVYIHNIFEKDFCTLTKILPNQIYLMQWSNWLFFREWEQTCPQKFYDPKPWSPILTSITLFICCLSLPDSTLSIGSIHTDIHVSADSVWCFQHIWIYRSLACNIKMIFFYNILKIIYFVLSDLS